MKAWQSWTWISVSAIAWVVVIYATHGARWSAHKIVGIAILIPAFCLWALARLQLGRSFAISAQAKQLVTQGLYSKIQNPVYVFGGLGLVGLFIYFGEPRLFLFFLILIPMQWMRVRNERRVLEAKFGEAYREYRRRTWF